MTSSAFPFISGRTPIEAPAVPVRRRTPRRHGGVLEEVRRRFRATSAVHNRRETT